MIAYIGTPEMHPFLCSTFLLAGKQVSLIAFLCGFVSFVKAATPVQTKPACLPRVHGNPSSLLFADLQPVALTAPPGLQWAAPSPICGKWRETPACHLPGGAVCMPEPQGGREKWGTFKSSESLSFKETRHLSRSEFCEKTRKEKKNPY